MNNFFKYVTPNQDDRKWGLYLNVAGFTRVEPHEEYPSPKHPSGYYFKWQNGRILNEYAFVYISEGKGLFETTTGTSSLSPGNLIIVQPDIWHRYKPDEKKGWTELYIGFSGTIAKQLMSHPLIKRSVNVDCGLQENLLDCFHRIFDLVKEEKPGFQMVASGLVMSFIGRVISALKFKDFAGTLSETIVEHAKFHIRQNLENKMNFEEYSLEHNVSYSNFRKIFKKYTGFSPCQYQINLRILKARESLLTSDKSIKQVAMDLGFESESYFTRCFKAKTGILPSELGKTFPPGKENLRSA
jgi:AraC-like DNA-binding protein